MCWFHNTKAITLKLQILFSGSLFLFAYFSDSVAKIQRKTFSSIKFETQYRFRFDIVLDVIDTRKYIFLCCHPNSQYETYSKNLLKNIEHKLFRWLCYLCTFIYDYNVYIIDDAFWQVVVWQSIKCSTLVERN